MIAVKTIIKDYNLIKRLPALKTTFMEQDFIFGITLTDNFDVKDYADLLKKEYQLTADEIKNLKPAYLFKLSDNIRFWQFDADKVLLDIENETYYTTGDFEPLDQVENKEIVALVNENNETEIIQQ